VSGRARALAGLTLALAAAVLLHPLCNLIFRCGCAPAWAGAAEHCNVRAPAGPRCPWCAHRGLGAFAFGLTLGGSGLVLGLAPRRFSPTRRTLVAVLAIPLLALLAGALAFLATDYPHFVAKNARPGRGPASGPRSRGP
jgi:hypothetical protein